MEVWTKIWILTFFWNGYKLICRRLNETGKIAYLFGVVKYIAFTKNVQLLLHYKCSEITLCIAIMHDNFGNSLSSHSFLAKISWKQRFYYRNYERDDLTKYFLPRIVEITCTLNVKPIQITV